MRLAVAAALAGSAVFLAGLFLLVALLCGWAFGLAAVLLTGGAAGLATGLLIIPTDHNGRTRRS